MTAVHFHQGTPNTPARRELISLNNPSAGIVAFDLPAPARHLSQVAHRILEALSADTPTSQIRASREQLPLISTDLLANYVSHVAIDNLEHATPALVTGLLPLLLLSHAKVWLLARQPLPPNTQDALNTWPHQRTRWTVVRRSLTPRTASQIASPKPRAPFPAVPVAPTLAFRAACQTELQAESAALVDRTYLQALRSTRSELTPEPDTAAVLASLRRQLRDASNVGHATTIVHAVAAAALTNGVLVQIEHDRFAAALENEPNLQVRTAQASSFAGRRPPVAAAIALTISGLTIQEIAELRLDALEQLAQDGHPLLQRQAIHRRIQGATHTDAAITTAAGHPVNPRWIRTALAAATSSGALAGPPRRQTTRDPDHRWARRLGIRARLL